MATTDFILLAASDAPTEPLRVRKAVALLSVTIKNMLEDFGDTSDVPIPLHNVTLKVLQRVVAHGEHHLTVPPAPVDDKAKPAADAIEPWDKDFCATLSQEELFELILAANYLDYKPLLDLTCKTVANLIKGKTPEEIRKTFNIKNDFTPEEEEKVRKENEWAEER